MATSPYVPRDQLLVLLEEILTDIPKDLVPVIVDYVTRQVAVGEQYIITAPLVGYWRHIEVTDVLDDVIYFLFFTAGNRLTSTKHRVRIDSDLLYRLDEFDEELLLNGMVAYQGDFIRTSKLVMNLAKEHDLKSQLLAEYPSIKQYSFFCGLFYCEGRRDMRRTKSLFDRVPKEVVSM